MMKETTQLNKLELQSMPTKQETMMASIHELQSQNTMRPANKGLLTDNLVGRLTTTSLLLDRMKVVPWEAVVHSSRMNLDDKHHHLVNPIIEVVDLRCKFPLAEPTMNTTVVATTTTPMDLQDLLVVAPLLEWRQDIHTTGLHLTRMITQVILISVMAMENMQDIHQRVTKALDPTHLLVTVGNILLRLLIHLSHTVAIHLVTAERIHPDGALILHHTTPDSILSNKDNILEGHRMDTSDLRLRTFTTPDILQSPILELIPSAAQFRLPSIEVSRVGHRKRSRLPQTSLEIENQRLHQVHMLKML
jgi:hypothetical protein